jgi:hypothetical protein
MTPQQISADVARGLELRDQIKTSLVELKTIEKRLEAAGLEGEQIPLQEADREGRQFLARSTKAGVVVPVVFESDQIIASVIAGTELHTTLTSIAGGHLSKFFTASNKLDRVQKDGQAFRKIARETFEQTAPAFINACLQRDKAGIPKSRTIIAWDNVKPLDQIPA